LEEAGGRKHGPLSEPKQLMLPYVYLGMDGISCGLIKEDCSEGGKGGRCEGKEEVLQTQLCCSRSERHVAVAKGPCIKSPAILCGVEALDASWCLGNEAGGLLQAARRHPSSPSAWAGCALGSNQGFLGLS